MGSTKSYNSNDTNTLACPSKNNSNTIELTVHTSSCWGRRLTLCYCLLLNNRVCIHLMYWVLFGYVIIRPYGHFWPSGSALQFWIFRLMVFIYSAFRLQPSNPASFKLQTDNLSREHVTARSRYCWITFQIEFCWNKIDNIDFLLKADQRSKVIPKSNH